MTKTSMALQALDAEMNAYEAMISRNYSVTSREIIATVREYIRAAMAEES